MKECVARSTKFIGSQLQFQFQFQFLPALATMKEPALCKKNRGVVGGFGVGIPSVSPLKNSY